MNLHDLDMIKLELYMAQTIVRYRTQSGVYDVKDFNVENDLATPPCSSKKHKMRKKLSEFFSFLWGNWVYWLRRLKNIRFCFIDFVLMALLTLF